MTVIGNYKLIAKPVDTTGKPWAAVDKQLCGAGGAYDTMNTLRKIFALLGMDDGRVMGYVAGTAVPRLPCSAYALKKTINTVQEEGLSARNACAVAHGILETSTMALFTTAFFSKNIQPALNRALVFNACTDAADFSVHACDYRQAKIWSKETAVQSSPELSEAVTAKIQYAALKMLKTLTGAIAGFFTAYTIFTGAVLIQPIAAAAISLVSSFAQLSAFYAKNYFASRELEVQYIKTA